jgi:outer membrane receptor for monomeric catechols
MNKLIHLAAIAVFALLGITAACVALSSVGHAQTTGNATVPTDQRTVLSTSTTNGVTTTLYVGRVQTDPNKDGTAALTVYPTKVLTDSAGNVLAEALDTSSAFTVPLTAQQYAGIASIITAAYASRQTGSISISILAP